MKLNKELVKKGLKNQLVSIGHLLIFNIISFILFWISFIGTKSIGNVSSSFFEIVGYVINLFFSISAWLTFLISFSIFYTKFLKKDLKKQSKIHWLFAVIFVIVSLIFGFVEFILFLIAAIFNIGIFGIVSNYQESIYVIVVVYVVGYIVIDIIREGIKKKAKTK